jgi:hypothetical protein
MGYKTMILVTQRRTIARLKEKYQKLKESGGDPESLERIEEELNAVEELLRLGEEQEDRERGMGR